MKIAFSVTVESPRVYWCRFLAWRIAGLLLREGLVCRSAAITARWLVEGRLLFAGSAFRGELDYARRYFAARGGVA